MSGDIFQSQYNAVTELCPGSDIPDKLSITSHHDFLIDGNNARLSLHKDQTAISLSVSLDAEAGESVDDRILSILAFYQTDTPAYHDTGVQAIVTPRIPGSFVPDVTLPSFQAYSEDLQVADNPVVRQVGRALLGYSRMPLRTTLPTDVPPVIERGFASLLTTLPDNQDVYNFDPEDHPSPALRTIVSNVLSDPANPIDSTVSYPMVWAYGEQDEDRFLLSTYRITHDVDGQPEEDLSSLSLMTGQAQLDVWRDGITGELIASSTLLLDDGNRGFMSTAEDDDLFVDAFGLRSVTTEYDPVAALERIKAAVPHIRQATTRFDDLDSY